MSRLLELPGFESQASAKTNSSAAPFQDDSRSGKPRLDERVFTPSLDSPKMARIGISDMSSGLMSGCSFILPEAADPLALLMISGSAWLSS